MNTKTWEVPATDGWSKKLVGWSEDGFYYLVTQEPGGIPWTLDAEPVEGGEDKPFHTLGHLITVTAPEVDWRSIPPEKLAEIKDAPIALWLEQEHTTPAAQMAAYLLQEAQAA